MSTLSIDRLETHSGLGCSPVDRPTSSQSDLTSAQTVSSPSAQVLSDGLPEASLSPLLSGVGSSSRVGLLEGRPALDFPSREIETPDDGLLGLSCGQASAASFETSQEEIQEDYFSEKVPKPSEGQIQGARTASSTSPADWEGVVRTNPMVEIVSSGAPSSSFACSLSASTEMSESTTPTPGSDSPETPAEACKCGPKGTGMPSPMRQHDEIASTFPSEAPISSTHLGRDVKKAAKLRPKLPPEWLRSPLTSPSPRAEAKLSKETPSFSSTLPPIDTAVSKDTYLGREAPFTYGAAPRCDTSLAGKEPMPPPSSPSPHSTPRSSRTEQARPRSVSLDPKYSDRSSWRQTGLQVLKETFLPPSSRHIPVMQPQTPPPVFVRRSPRSSFGDILSNPPYRLPSIFPRPFPCPDSTEGSEGTGDWTAHNKKDSITGSFSMHTLTPSASPIQMGASGLRPRNVTLPSHPPSSFQMPQSAPAPQQQNPRRVRPRQRTRVASPRP